MHVLILGANSEVAQALARKFAEREKAHLYLASRDIDLLEKQARDLEIRYQIKGKSLYFDATDYLSHEAFYQALDPKPDVAIVAFGYLGNQGKGQENFSQARKILETNLVGAVSILEVVAADFEKRGHGVIIGISSVAGERGRQTNYLYGAAKGGLTVYLSGLRNRLFKRNVRVITVLPGFIRSKMTEHLDFPEKLTSRPDEVADDIFSAYQKKKDIIYSKWLWKWIMLIIDTIPETIFKRMKI